MSGDLTMTTRNPKSFFLMALGHVCNMVQKGIKILQSSTELFVAQPMMLMNLHLAKRED